MSRERTGTTIGGSIVWPKLSRPQLNTTLPYAVGRPFEVLPMYVDVWLIIGHGVVHRDLLLFL